MALTKTVTVDYIGVVPNGILEIRLAKRMFDNGVEESKRYHRYCLSPGDDLTNADPRVAAVASAVWTDEIIAAYVAAREATA